jgi:hypothetical protein
MYGWMDECLHRSMYIHIYAYTYACIYISMISCLNREYERNYGEGKEGDLSKRKYELLERTKDEKKWIPKPTIRYHQS